MQVIDLVRFHRGALAVTALSAAVILAGCSDLKPGKEACSVTVAPPSLSVPMNGSQQIVGTAFDCDGNSIRNKKISYSSNNTSIATVTTEGSVIGVGVGVTQVSANADGHSASAQVTVSPEAAQTVTVTPGTATLRRTNVKTFSAVAKNGVGTVITGRTFRWSSSNSSVASVDQNGAVTAIAPGNVTISAETDQISGSANIVVTEIPIGSCTLTPPALTLIVNKQAQPTVALKDTADHAMSSLGRAMTWFSDAEITAVVTGTGVITGRKAGTATITAANPDNPAINCKTVVTVVDPTIASATITPHTAILRLSIPKQFTVSLTDPDGVAITTTGRTITWGALDPSVAVVSSSGVVTGLSLGNARITVDAEGKKDTVTVSVTKIPIGRITLSPGQTTIIQGTSTVITAVVEDSVGNTVTDRPLEWSSSDPVKATVVSNGQNATVTANGTGTVTITATSTADGKSGQSTVTLQQVPVATITAPPTYATTLSNVTGSFAIQLKDANGNLIINRTVLVTSSDPDVATGSVVNPSTEVKVTPKKEGSTIFTIRAFDTNGQPQGAPATVTVTILPNS